MAARSERTWVMGAGVAGLVILLIGWFFVVAPERAENEDIQSRTADAQTQNLTLQNRITSLQAAQKDHGRYEAALRAVRRALPGTPALSVFLLDVQTIAKATSTRVTALQVGKPEPFVAAATRAGTGTTASGAAPTSAAPADPSAGGTPGGPATAPGTGSNILAIDISASVLGSPGSLGGFLTRLQTGQPRAVLLTDVARNGSGAKSAVLQLKLTAFVSSAAPASPAGGSSPAPPGG